MEIRCSKLPIIANCAGSLGPCEQKEIVSPYAVSGRRLHVKLAAMVDEKPITDDEDKPLIGQAQVIWNEIKKKYFQRAVLTEHRLESKLIPYAGTADVVCVDQSNLAVLDWKSGYSKDEHDEQLQGYADLLRTLYGTQDGCVITLEVWVRFNEYRVSIFSKSMLDKFRAHVLAQIADGKTKSAGTHCKYCPHVLSCVVRDQYLQSGVSWIEPLQQNKLALPDLVKNWDRIKMIKRAIEDYETLVRDLLSDQKEIQLDDKRVLRLSVLQRDEIQPDAAYPILTGECGLTSAEFVSCTSMSKAALVDIIKSKVPRGEKQTVADSVISKLRSIGAIKQTSFSKLDIKKV